MSPSPISSPGFPAPTTFSATDSIDTASFASMANSISSDKYGGGLYPGQSQSLSPEQSSQMAAIQSSYQTQPSSSPASQTTTLSTVTTPAASASAAATPSSVLAASSVAISQSSASEQSISTTSPTATAAATVVATSNASSSSSAGASSAANTSSNDLQAQASTMSSPGMQAAIAVPVVVVVLAALGLIFFCMRRRRKRREAAEGRGTLEKRPIAARKKNWTRHFRVFSFDTELLMGGRFSSTNSIRSRQTGSLRSATRSQNSESPSIHSVDEVAPPYRDAIHAAQPPTIAQVIAGGAIGGAAAGVGRSASSATAPPPYGAAAGAAGKVGSGSPTTPGSQRSGRNPFADSPPISPVEASPFNDPPGTTPVVSRNSSLYRSDRDDASSVGGFSDAASIRQATLARNASVMSGGRIINNVSDRAS